MEGACNTLKGVLVETGTIVVFKKLLDWHMAMQGMEKYRLCADISLTRHNGWYGHSGLKGLFLCCTVLCSNRSCPHLICSVELNLVDGAQKILWLFLVHSGDVSYPS